MKKSLAILSMALLAGNAFAADVLEVGTVEAPKYYVIKANRGVPYVAYSADKKDNGGAETSLYRSNELSEATVWAVVPGSEEGTVNIYNYQTKDEAKRKAYMFSFITKDGAEFVGGLEAVATTGGAKDIYVKNYGNGGYGLALENEDGLVGDGYYALDATGGTSEFLGNWKNAKDGGTQWWFYAVDVANGVEAGLAAAEKVIKVDRLKQLEGEQKAFAADYIAAMQAIIANVPAVESEFTEAIDMINELDIVEDYETQIKDIWFGAIEEANNSMKTAYTNKVVGLKNIRRADPEFNQVPYIAISGSTLTGVASFIDASADFTMQSAGDGSYYFYNEAANAYIGADCSVAADQASAQLFDIIIAAGGDFYGVGLCPAGQTTDGINWQSWKDGAISIYSVTDPGSIWSIVEANDEAKVKDAVAGSIARIKPYINYVPAMVANLLQAGIDELNSLPYSDDLVEKADALANATIENANNLLTTGMNGLEQVIYYPRENRYLYYNTEAADWANATAADVENGVFTIKTVEGGVVLFNEANNIYVGPCVYFGKNKELNEKGEVVSVQVDVPAVEEESEAQVFTVELNNNSGYYGVSFLFTYEYEVEEEGATVTKQGQQALNMNTNAKCLHTYYAADGGSIFVLKNVPEDSSIDEITVVAPAVQGIYDLAGRKLAAPVKGINIINGKKVLVK